MEKEEMRFRAICEKLSSAHAGVAPGKMMASSAICYEKKVFAFYYKQEMIFKLGKDFDPTTANIQQFTFLNPFKNKPPMTAWFCIKAEEEEKWETLAILALEKAKTATK